jgi:hypothetical protein
VAATTTPVLSIPGGAATVNPYPGSTPNQNFNVAPPGGPIAAGDLYAILNTVDTGAAIALFLPEPGGPSRHTRISENGSPLPQDRVFLNYSYLDSVINGANVNHFMLGVEKTFLDGRFSVQVNVPIASTLSSTQYYDSGASAVDGQFGNISVWLKALAYRSDCSALSFGVGVNTPTANDVEAFAAATDTTPLLVIQNQAITISPFVGAYSMLSDRAFVQGFAQVDVDTNGNNVDLSGTSIGRIMAPVLGYAGVGVGYTVYQDDSRSNVVRRITPMVETHYTTDLGTAATFTNGSNFLASRSNNLDVLNVTAGTSIGLGCRSNLNLAFATPLITDNDRQFNWQALAQFQYLFGPRQ